MEIMNDPQRTQSDAQPIRLIGYGRVSTEDQLNNGVSLDAQRTRLEAHAKACGYELAGIVTDNGVSGKVPPQKREGLTRALQSIESGDAHGLVFLKLDRLSRSVRDILKLAEDARRGGWNLISVQESLDSSTPSGKMILTVLAALAEMEREQLGERTRMGMEQVAKEGRARSGRIPFGFRVGSPSSRALIQKAGDRRKLVEHAAEQTILQQMRSLREQGLGPRRIARALNEVLQLNPRTGALWTPGNVASILRTAERRASLLQSPGVKISPSR